MVFRDDICTVCTAGTSGGIQRRHPVGRDKWWYSETTYCRQGPVVVFRDDILFAETSGGIHVHSVDCTQCSRMQQRKPIISNAHWHIGSGAIGFSKTDDIYLALHF